MSDPLIIETDFILTSPAFLGDAETMAALRPQSFKGLLRHWHRTVDAGLCAADKNREDRIWGGTEKKFGQSKVLLRIRQKGEGKRWRYNRNMFARFSTNDGKNPFNGITYLGYPFGMGNNKKRDALAPMTQFTLQGVVPAANDIEEQDIQAIIASFWLLAVLGSCGSRARRGFGSLRATAWRLVHGDGYSDWQKVFRKLPVPGQANSPGAWQKAMAGAMALFTEWFGMFPENTAHGHLGRQFRPVILPGHNDWQEAMAAGGEKMQRFRRTSKPDYDIVRNFLTRPADNMAGPEKSSFGLPLSFRFKKDTVVFLPVRFNPNMDNPDRLASQLYLKIIRLGMRFHPLYFLLDGRGADPDLETQAQYKGRIYSVRNPENSAVQDFFEQLQKENQE